LRIEALIRNLQALATTQANSD